MLTKVTWQPRRFSKKNLAGRYCLSPYVAIEVGITGDVRLCNCAAWMPATVGNLFKQSLPDILSNAASQNIRDSISQGTYEFCNEHTCGVLEQQQLVDRSMLEQTLIDLIDDPSKYIMPREIWIAGDRTCNLSCPSCRRSVIKNSEEEINQLIELGEILQKNLFPQSTDQKINLHCSTSGEVFASPLLMSLLGSIPVDDFPNLTLALQTNGLLAEKNWHRLGGLRDRISSITVTTDAARGDTYEILRRGGAWSDMQRSLSWIQEKKHSNGMLLSLRMVVQKQNYQEIPEFYAMADQFGADVIEFSRILDWGTFRADEFRTIDVFDPNHAEFGQAQDLLNQVKSLPKTFLCGGLS